MKICAVDMSVAGAIRDMIAAGLTVEQALTAAEIMERHTTQRATVDEAAERRREKDRLRKRAEKSTISTEIPHASAENVEKVSLSPSLSSSPPIPSLITLPTPNPSNLVLARDLFSEQPVAIITTKPVSNFDEFWEAYGHKVSRDGAKAAYDKTIKAGVAHEFLMEQILRYREYWGMAETVPREVFIPSQPHASTWLNQKRYNDDIEKVVADARRKANGFNIQRGGPTDALRAMYEGTR